MANEEDITQDYLDFVKAKKVRNLTRNQWRFVEFLLRNKRETARMGSYEQLFRKVRTYLKNDYDWSKEPIEDKKKNTNSHVIIGQGGISGNTEDDRFEENGRS